MLNEEEVSQPAHFSEPSIHKDQPTCQGNRLKVQNSQDQTLEESCAKTARVSSDKSQVQSDGPLETFQEPARTIMCSEAKGSFDKDIPKGDHQPLAQLTSIDLPVVVNKNLGYGHQQQHEIHMGRSRCSENIILYERLDTKAPKSKETMQEALPKNSESNKTDMITPAMNIRAQENSYPNSQATSRKRSNHNHEKSSNRPCKSYETSSNRSRCSSNLTQTSSNTKLSLERGDILLNDKTSILCSGYSPPLSRSPAGFSQPNLSWDQTSVKQREQSPQFSVHQHLTRQSADILTGGDGARSKQISGGYQQLGQVENSEVDRIVTSEPQHHTFPWRYRVLVTQDFHTKPPPHSGGTQHWEISRSNESRSTRSCKCHKIYKRRELRVNPPSHTNNTVDSCQKSSSFRIKNAASSQQNSSPSRMKSTAVSHQNYYHLEPLHRSSRPTRSVRRFLVRNEQFFRKTDGFNDDDPHKQPYYLMSRDLVGVNKCASTAVIQRSYLKHLNRQRRNKFARVQMQNGFRDEKSYLGWAGGFDQNRNGFIQNNPFDSVDQNNPWIPVFDQLDHREKLLVYEAIKRLLNKK